MTGKQLVSLNVRRLRLSQGLSQKALADAAGLQQPKISLIEVAKHDPQTATLDALASALDVPTAELFRPVKK